MKKQFTLLFFVLISVIVISQTQINVNGTINTFSSYKGATGADLYIRAPKRTLNIVFHAVDSVGNLQIDPVDSILAFYTGNAWRKTLSEYKASLLYQPIGNYLSGTDTSNMSAAINLKLNKSDTTGKWKPSNWFPLFSQVLSRPTTLIGYGITDAYPLTGNPSGFLMSEIDGSITNEIELPSQSGQSGKYLSTNGFSAVWQSLPTIKRQETYSGTTNSSGNYTVTFSTSYPVAPNIQANAISNNPLYRTTITNITTTGFTVNVSIQNTAVISLVSVLLPGVTAVNGASVDVLITEK